jgi:hypothetical protein
LGIELSFALAKQTLYHLSHAPVLILFLVHLSDGVLLFSHGQFKTAIFLPLPNR